MPLPPEREFMSSFRTVTTGTQSSSEGGVPAKPTKKSGDGSVVVVWDEVIVENPDVTKPKKHRDYSLECVREPPKEEENEKGLFRYRNILVAVVICLAMVATIVVVFVVQGGGGGGDDSQASAPPANQLADNVGVVATESPSQAAQTTTQAFSPTMAPTALPTEWKLTCGCQDCIEEILQRDARGQTCEARILEEINENGMEEMDACSKVSTLYPLECGPHCHPDKCDGQAPAHCSCQECTAQIFDADTGSFTCREFMLLMMQQQGISEDEACVVTSERFPDICGVGCNPQTCPSNNQAVEQEPEPEFQCGCASCDELAWNTNAGGSGVTCGERISWLQSIEGGGLNSTWACLQIANSEFPEECWACNPMTCHQADVFDDREEDENQTPPSPPTFCGCPACVPDVLNVDANGVTCANRIAWLQTLIGQSHSEIEACAITTQEEYPEHCGRQCDPDRCHDPTPMCGCASCTEEVLNRVADGATCKERIFYTMSQVGGGHAEDEACRLIGGIGRVYNSICGECDPTTC